MEWNNGMEYRLNAKLCALMTTKVSKYTTQNGIKEVIYPVL